MPSTAPRAPGLAALLLALAFPLAAAEIPIGGRVTAGGKPAPEAKVLLVPVVGSHEQGQLLLAGTAGPEPIAKTQPDADGVFRLAAPGIGLYEVRVELEGRVPREMKLLPLLHPIELPAVDLEHDSGLEITLTADGEPVTARLAAFPSDPAINRLFGRAWPLSEPGKWSRPTFVGRSDGNGVVRVPATGEEKAWALEAVAEGLVPRAQVVPRPGRRLPIGLWPGIERPVETRGSRGEPLPGALIYPEAGVLPLALSGPRGRAVLVAPPGGWLAVTASDAGLRRGTLRLPPPEPDAPAPEVAEIVLEEPRVVNGQVVAAASGEPIAGALVWAGVEPLAGAVETGGGGHYTLSIPGALAEDARFGWVWAAAEGFLPGSLPGGSGDAPGPTIALFPAAGLAGRVVDAGGQGLAGVEIGISRIETERMRSRGLDLDQRRARTFRDGRFRLPGLPTESSYRLRFAKAGFAPAKLDVEGLEPFAERSDLEVVLYAGRRAVGTVVDESDLPVAGAEVRLVESDPKRRARFLFDEEEPATAFYTDVRGGFAVPDLGPGRYDLEVSSPGFGPVSVPGVEVPEGAGEVDVGTVILPPGAAIEGRVVDAGGQAVAGVEIRATEPRGRPVPAALQRLALAQMPPDAVTDAAGGFTVADRRPGERVDLNVAAGGYVAQTVAGVVAPPEEPLEIVLQAASRVAGRVVDAAGDAVAGASVRVQPEGLAGSGGRRFGSLSRARSADDGRFEILGVEPGRLTLVARADGYQESRLSGLEAPPGGELADVELVLRAGAVVRGVVRTAGGAPVFQARVSVAETGAAGAREGWAMTDGDGRFELSGLGIGRRIITVRDESSRTVRKTVDVEAGTQSVEITFAAGVDVSGRVVGPAGAGVAGASVALTGASERWPVARREATSGADGSFTLSEVAPGTYGLQATHRDFADGESEGVEVAASPIAGLEIRLRQGVVLRGRLLGLDVDELAQVRVVAGHRLGRVDFEGAYSVPNLSPGEVYVRAEIPGTGRQAVEFVTLEESAGEVTLDLEFGRGHVLTGTVVLGVEVLPAVTVRLEGTSVRHGARDVTDHEGRFRLEGLESGTYRLSLHSFESGVEHSEELEVLADDDVRVEIGSGRIAGRVRDRSDSGAVEGVRLRLKPAGGDGSRWSARHQATSDSEGRFGFGAVPAGSWTLVAVKAGYADAEAAVEMSAGDVVQDLEVLLSPSRRFAFEVAAATPVGRVFVAFLDGAGRRVGGGAHDAAEGGRVEVTTVPDGSWEMLVAAGDSATTSSRVTVPGDAGRIPLAPGGGVEVRVPDLADGLVEAELRLVGADGRAHRSVGWGGGVSEKFPLRSGRATVRNLAPGAWTLVVTAADGRSWQGSAVVVAGEPVAVTLR